MRFIPALAVVATALALYVSAGVLDQVETPRGLVRAALLPPWQSLLGFAGMGALALLWLHRRAIPRGTATAVRTPLGALVLPAFALLLLVLPYLPVIPDRFPALQILAGPVRLVVWLVVATQLGWTLWQSRVIRADWLQRLTVGQATLLIAIATAAITGGTAVRMVNSVLYPGGDEPHYLVIAQSLWRDGDLRIANNHQRGDYYEYFELELAPHYLTRGANGAIYSIHPVGMPVMIAPVYAAGGYHAVVAVYVLMATFAAAFMWRTSVRVTNAVGASTFAWAAIVATAPFLYNSFAIYPEIPAAVAVVVAFTLIAVSSSDGIGRWIIVGLACAALPWLSTKYAPMSATLVAIALGRLMPGPLAPESRRRSHVSSSRADADAPPEDLGAAAAATRWDAKARLVAVLLPYAVSLAGWFYFFYALWGIPLPQAPYGALVQTDVRNLVFGGPGLIFDQEYGLLPYAPVYILAATGLWAMVRTDADARRRAIEIALVLAALVGTVGAFRIWWGGSASPGRPITSGLLLLLLPIAYAFRAAAVPSARRSAQHLLLWASIGIAGILLFAQQGLLTANERDGTSTLLEYLSTRWPAWTIVPSFIYHEPATALLLSALWLILAAGAGWLLRRLPALRPGTQSLAVMLSAAGALSVAALTMPRVPVHPPWPGLDIRARARVPLLDEFDTVARPVAVEYSPLQLRRAADVVTQASVMVAPELRKQPQPIRVLHNGRFSLPAGTYRIDIDWSAVRQGDRIGLQIGRTGDPLTYWTVNAQPGQRWSAEFTTPVDAPFVGLRSSAEIEQAIERIRITPLAVTNAGERRRGPAVLAASQSGPASIYYYDTNASPERTGFWVLGERRTQVAIARPRTAGALFLRVHSGPVANRLHVSMFGWNTSVDLRPEAPTLLEVPSNDADLITLEFASDAAFVPRTLDPSSTDIRALGVWVEVVK
jgi:hypothetical protein